jgi:hypothetical protein
MKFTDPGHLWSINNKGIWLSKDTAKTWQPIWSTDYFTGGYSFDFIDSSNGLLAYGYGGIELTSDEGENWEYQSLLRGIQFRDAQLVGTDISGNYRIFLTGDKGRITKYVPDIMPYENHYPSFTMKRLNDISMIMECQLPHLWFAGEGFTVLKGNTELVVDVEKIKEDFVADFRLEQNYPNPFNPSTKIKYQIPLGFAASPFSKGGFVTLKVYDILAREVATLVNEEKPVGTYEVTWYAEQLPSGVYFYQLKAGDFISTKKMLLLK